MPHVESHLFLALCQNPGCPGLPGRSGKAPLARFHVPAPGGVLQIPCHACRHVSQFTITVTAGIQGQDLGAPASRK